MNPECPNDVKPLTRVVRDESTFYENCDQSNLWGDHHTNVLKQKSLGQSIMVSDFIDERVWCHANKHARAYCQWHNHQIVPEALQSCTKEIIFTKCRDYEHAYNEVEQQVKFYKSHITEYYLRSN